MACNCKKTADEMRKYSDDGAIVQHKPSLLLRFFTFINQLFFGTIIASIVLILIIPIIIYILLCIMIGKEPSIRLIQPFKKKNRN